MGLTQTFVATLAVVLFIILTLSLNESVFKVADLTKDAGDTCEFFTSDRQFHSLQTVKAATCLSTPPTYETCEILNAGSQSQKTCMEQHYCTELKEEANVSTDTRELLYGALSVRYANIVALVLGGVAFLIVVFSKSLDIDMESKYEKDSYMLSGTPRAYLTGILFRLCAAGAALAMTLSTLLVVPALGVEAASMPGVNRSMTFDKTCEDLGPNHIERFDMLAAILVLSASSVVAVGFMVYAIKYDAKASA